MCYVMSWVGTIGQQDKDEVGAIILRGSTGVLANDAVKKSASWRPLHDTSSAMRIIDRCVLVELRARCLHIITVDAPILEGWL